MKKSSKVFDSTDQGEPSFRKKLLFADARANVMVWLVDGEYVRNHLNIEYVEGGHHYRYDFIPENEVWLEETLDKREISETLVHELHERRRMKHDGWDYDKAHEEASKVEAEVRALPNTIKQVLKEEMAAQ